MLNFVLKLLGPDRQFLNCSHVMLVTYSMKMISCVYEVSQGCLELERFEVTLNHFACSRFSPTDTAKSLPLGFC